MNGVEILTSTQVVVNTVLNMSAFWAAFGIVFMAFTLIGVVLALDYTIEWPSVPLWSIFGVIVGILMGLVFGGDVFPKETIYETRYKVTISDEVSMTKFCERYEVINQDGKIFTVREKANE